MRPLAGPSVAKVLRRIGVACTGTLVVLVGMAAIVLPVPATMVIPAGLAILATEFMWARRLLVRVRDRAGSVAARLRRSPDLGP